MAVAKCFLPSSQPNSSSESEFMIPRNDAKVWTTEYYKGILVKFDVSSGVSTFSVPKKCSLTGTVEPEGVRVDTSGNVWVAEELCSVLLKFNPPSNTWTSYNLLGSSIRPLFIAYDSVNSKLWITSQDQNKLITFVISSGSSSSVGLPPNVSNPVAVAVDPASGDLRTYVAFQSPGDVGIYWFGSSPLWLCVDATGAAYGVSFNAPNIYWVSLNVVSKLVKGYC